MSPALPDGTCPSECAERNHPGREHDAPPLPPLTADEFNLGSGHTFRGVPVIENEDGDWIFAYGHVDPETMAGAVNDYNVDNGTWMPLGDGYTAEDVQHLYAVTIKGPDDPDGWWIDWSSHDTGPVTKDTPGAFPITVVDR